MSMEQAAKFAQEFSKNPSLQKQLYNMLLDFTLSQDSLVQIAQEAGYDVELEELITAFQQNAIAQESLRNVIKTDNLDPSSKMLSTSEFKSFATHFDVET